MLIMRVRWFVAALVILSLAAQHDAAGQTAGVDPRPPNAPNHKPAFAGQTRAPEQKSNVVFNVVTVAGGLENGWGMTFLPGGKILVTEKPGRLRVVDAKGTLSAPVTGLPAVDPQGQG